MLIEAVVLALIISVLSGRKISQLGQLTLREFWLIPLALIIQGGVNWAAVRGIKLGPMWLSPVLDTMSYFLLLVFTLCNRLLPGMRIITLGILLNTIVIAVNGGVMPVDLAFLREATRKALQAGEGTHGLVTSVTHLRFLTDRFYVNILGLHKQVCSIGDCLIDIGIFLLIFKSSKRRKYNIEVAIEANPVQLHRL